MTSSGLARFLSHSLLPYAFGNQSERLQKSFTRKATGCPRSGSCFALLTFSVYHMAPFGSLLQSKGRCVRDQLQTGEADIQRIQPLGQYFHLLAIRDPNAWLVFLASVFLGSER